MRQSGISHWDEFKRIVRVTAAAARYLRPHKDLLEMKNQTMKAVGVYKALPPEDPESLVNLDVPLPVPGPLDLLVKVEAISVNPADCRARNRKRDDGRYAIVGWDAAGVVVSVGSDVEGTFRPGDAVYYAGDLNRPGANSEFHAVDSRIVGYRPVTLPAAQASAIPLAALTVWEALFERMGLSISGGNRLRSLLIVGGAGGTGSMAIQLAALIPDVTVIATASRRDSQTWCRQLGADMVINHFGDVPEQLAKVAYSQVDAILLLNSPDEHFPVAAEIIAPQGCICSIVPFDRPPDLNAIMRKSVTFAWEFMFTRSMFRTSDIAKQRTILSEVAALIDAGRITPIVTNMLGPINARNLRTAHGLLETRRTIGKITLTGFQPED
jgi:zinc-binding alcohol dehydrogenase family protein